MRDLVTFLLATVLLELHSIRMVSRGEVRNGSRYQYLIAFDLSVDADRKGHVVIRPATNHTSSVPSLAVRRAEQANHHTR